MLRRLLIRNYAIISEVDIDFHPGLNIITGETGAGKSILIGALGLILGDRADSTVLLNKDSKCMVEGYFQATNRKDVRSFFAAHDLDTDEEIILRREISSAGKSRAFINDTPVSLSQMQQLAGMLVDLHQQFDNRELGQSRFQLEVIDALARQLDLCKNYEECYRRYIQSRDTWTSLVKKKDDALKEYDYYHFLHQELADAALHPGELESMESELTLLSHAEQVNGVLFRVQQSLEGAEQPITQQLKSLAQSLESVGKFHAPLGALADRLRSAQIELADIASETEQISSALQMDEKRMQELNDRLSAGYKLLKKHNVKTTDQLLGIQESLQKRIGEVLHMDEEIIAADTLRKSLLAEAESLAAAISAGRKGEMARLEKNTAALLKQVGMPNARMKIDMQPATLSFSGIDDVEFLFDANKSNRFEPLRKVASGGEFSRLLLCIKTLVAGALDMPVLIFDEIDTGISGEAAKQVGILMKNLGHAHQVIAITHQPQIAARADAHYFVFKKETNGMLRTQLRKLGESERVESIARMMSGEKPSASALQSAREMIGG